ncbi:MAG: hypothetical protein ONA90_07980, partial [candidate division KSB1 bacterium]|nr:hypothetical protein [candidate division KSB1 bacterium]
MFTKISNWAQKFLSTNTMQRFERWMRSRWQKARVALTQRISPLFRCLKQNRRARTIFFLACLTPSLLIFLMVVLLPVAFHPFHETNQPKFENIGDEPVVDSIDREILKERYTLSNNLISLQIDQAFWQARLSLAKRDSINLSVDLTDSLINL